MKKSFMTRVLATGLSLAMAFSLTAATNVTVASAASTPAMASKQFAVRVGGAAKSYKASAATRKSYKISKATVGNTDKATVKVNSSKKSIKVTPGTVTGSTVVKISFKNIKTKKTTSKKYRCVVKAAVVEKQAIVKAEATGVKTITLTMAKEVASVESPVAITVKKATADRPCKATAEGKTITLAMDAKLTQGAYTVSIAGMEDTALTADFNVEKDETLTSFEVDDNLVAKSVTETTTGTIKFAALNQYGEKMTAADPTVTCTFGKVTNTNKPSKSATATAKGEITVEDINVVLAIPGTKGIVTLVGDMGVTTSKEITYNTFAKATKAELVGVYHVNTAKLTTLKEDDKIIEYELLFKFIDQYGSEMSESNLGDTVRVTVAGGLTKLQVDAVSGTSGVKTRTYDGNDYVAVPLTGTATKALAGEASLIVTCDYSGMLINDKITVAKNVVIKSVTITADNGIYWGQENELSYEFIDQDGNSVTDYTTLVENCGVNFGTKSGMRFERQSDGKAKLIIELQNDGSVNETEPSQSNTDKASAPLVRTCYANSQTGGDYLVKTFSFTMKEHRVAKGVTGIKDDATVSISASDTGSNIEIEADKIILADQYSNPLKSGEKAFNSTLVAAANTGSVSSGTSVYIKTDGAFAAYVDETNNKIIATPQGISNVGTATVYLKYKWTTNTSKQSDPVASDSNYDAKFTLTAYDTKNVDVSTLYIDSVYDNRLVTTKEAVDMTTANIVVKAKVGGVNTVIPKAQFTIVSKGDKDFGSKEDTEKIDTINTTVKVQVTTWDSSNTPISTVLTKDYTIARTKSKLYKVDSTVADKVTGTHAISGNAVFTADAATNVTGFYANGFKDAFYFKDQYGAGKATATVLAGSAKYGTLDTGCATYKIEVIESYNKDTYTILHNETNKAEITITNNAYCKFKVTVTAADGSTKSVTYVVNSYVAP